MDSISRVALLALTPVILWVVAGCDPSKPAVSVPVPVRVSAARDAATAKGQRGAAYLATIKGRNQLTLSFRVPGIVDRIGPGSGSGDWQEGAVVGRGQLLAQLKQADFLAASNSAAAQATLDLTQFDRTQRLFKEGAASQQEKERAVAAKDASEAVLELRRQDILDSRILAPLAGTILKREVSAGETIGAGRPVLTLADLSEVEVEVGVPDRLVGLVRVGSTVHLTVSMLENRDFVGEVKEVGVAAHEGSRLFRVVVRVGNSEGRLRPGMTASVDLEDMVGHGVGAMVQLSALVARSEKQLAVFVVTNGVARERAVGTSDILESSIVVTNGLQPGEWVVVAGASELHDGAAVEATVVEPKLAH